MNSPLPASTRQRLDDLLVQRGLFASRSRARDAVERGTVTVDGAISRKPGQNVSPQCLIAIDDPAQGYVSRAALKLIAGLDHFGLDPAGGEALDIGASTGGFTQVLLERGASHVTAIDVGHGQMHPDIGGDPRVTVIEGLNARALIAAELAGRIPDFIVSDVSFISLKLALPPALAIAKAGARGLFLVKPQFEAGREAIGKGGLLKDPYDAARVAGLLQDWLDAVPGWRSLGLHLSPIEGGDGNREFLLGGVKGSMSVRFTIKKLGAQGDGIAETESGDLFIPFTLPGETVTAAREKDRATLMAVLEASPLRIDPACRHFTECGGCALQHLEAEAYRRWKRDKVVHALKGIDCDIAELVACAPHTRRRVVLAARRSETGMLLGFNRHLSPEIISISECPISLPGIVSALDRLRALAELVCATTKSFRLAVTMTGSGLDIAVHESGKLGENQRRIAANFVIAQGFARLSIDDEIIIEPRKPVVMFGTVAVALPPGAFLQATEAAEQTMADIVGAHLKRAKKVADLFAGCGSFALRLAAKSEVHAVEGDAAALSALDRGSRFATGLKRVTGERRDLFRRPLTFKELNAFDGLVFDPPRAGAEDQSKQIARSDVPLVAAVSCNPVTLARDLRVLVDGGYTLKSVTPIDQFLWSPHVEAVALLEKPRKRRV